MTSPKRPFVIHPLLFAAFPVLFLYAQNSHFIKLSEIVGPLLVIGGLSIALTVICGLAAKSLEKGAILATPTIFFFLSFGHLTSAMPEFKYVLKESVVGPTFVTLAAGILLLAALAGKMMTTKRNLNGVTKFLNTIGLVLIAIQVLLSGYALATRQDPETVDQTFIAQVEETGRRPDIYYIIVDGYARSDILKNIYDYDNSQFLSDLQDLGFFIADSSFSNYPQTQLSMSSALNMDYVCNLGEIPRTSLNRILLKKKAQKNPVAGFLKSLGYTTVAFASGYSTTVINADQVISPGWFDKELPSLIMAITPLPTLFGAAHTSLARHRRRILNSLDRIPKLSGIRSPKFVLAHILSPHMPFAFDADGNEVQYAKHWTLADGVTMIKDSSDAEKYRQRYREQTTFITRRVSEMIKELVESYGDEPPVIILQADHGPASGLNWHDWTVSNLRERFGILNAYLLPGAGDSVLYDEITPVNSFRVVFNQYFGTDFELLADRHEFSSMGRPFATQFVTKHLGQNAYDHLMRQYRRMPPDSVTLKEVSEPVKEGTDWGNDSYRTITERGLLIKLDSTVFASNYEASFDWNDEYEVRYRLDTVIVGTDHIVPEDEPGGRLRLEKRPVPESARARGFDNILILPRQGDYVYGFGHLIFH